MMRFRRITLVAVACVLASLICVMWFSILSATTQDGEVRVEYAGVRFGWPLPSFSGNVDFETFDEAGWFETIRSISGLKVHWLFFAINLAVLVVLSSGAARIAAWAVPFLRSIRLQHYFGLLAFAAWYIWMDKSLFDYRDMEVEIILRVYAQRSTWIFVLAGCLSFLPLFNALLG